MKRIYSAKRFYSLAIVLTVLITSFTAVMYARPAKVSAVTPKSALIYGDSLTRESRWEINEQFATKTGWTNYVHSYGGTAPCDWLGWLPYDLWIYNPSVVAIETAGNSTTDCMKDSDGVRLPVGSQAYFDKYTADLDALFSQITGQSRKVVFIKAPPMANTTWDSAINQIDVIATQLAGKYHGVSIASGPRNSVSNSGKYVAYKTCLATETAAMGCGTDGKIAIRTISNIDVGVHLCPTGLVNAVPPSTCSVYSSGEFRFGKALANTTVSPPAPILP